MMFKVQVYVMIDDPCQRWHSNNKKNTGRITKKQKQFLRANYGPCVAYLQKLSIFQTICSIRLNDSKASLFYVGCIHTHTHTLAHSLEKVDKFSSSLRKI